MDEVGRIKDILRKCKNADEWDAACDEIRNSSGGHYPDFWYKEIMLSGFSEEIAMSWGGSKCKQKQKNK